MYDGRFDRRRGSHGEQTVAFEELFVRCSTRRKSTSDGSALTLADGLTHGLQDPNYDITSDFAQAVPVELALRLKLRRIV
jgi:hypothetical protein